MQVLRRSKTQSLWWTSLDACITSRHGGIFWCVTLLQSTSHGWLFCRHLVNTHHDAACIADNRPEVVIIHVARIRKMNENFRERSSKNSSSTISFSVLKLSVLYFTTGYYRISAREHSLYLVLALIYTVLYFRGVIYCPSSTLSHNVSFVSSCLT
jgi:hypothetical protein